MAPDDQRPIGKGGRCMKMPLDRKRFKLRFRMRFPSSHREINHAVEQVMHVACECLPCKDGDPDLEIALREALANAVTHGNEGEPDKVISLRCYGSEEDGVIIAVRDQGAGFDPDRVPDPRSSENLFLHHGRGIFLMRELMDHVEHRKGGREVVMHKIRRSGGQDRS